jgi:YVTN family beta-propeller protein
MWKWSSWRAPLAVALGGLLLSQADTSRPAQAENKGNLCRPVALALADNDRWLLVANQRAGSVTVIDTAARKITAEFPVSRKLADLALTPDGRHVLAVDEEANQLIVLSRSGPTLAVLGRLSVSPAPVSVQAAADGTRCFVASLWSRRLSIVELGLPAALRPRVKQVIDLPFAPRRQLLLPRGSKLVVADSFGGKVGLVDVGQGRLESVRSIPGHNLRGLALSRDGARLLVAHQIMHDRGQSTQDDIHWGNLMTNNLRSLAVATLLNPQADLLRGSDLRYLGQAGNAAGDPAGVAVTAEDQVVVALAGVGEIILGPEPQADWERLAVGRRPTAVAAAADGRTAYVANTFGDSVSVVDLKAGKVQATITLGSAAPRRLSDRGEELFYDARLSHNAWFSCHSCHSDGHSNGLLNDNLSDGTLGTPKRVLSVLGVRDTGPWAWNGSMPDLETQIRQSVQSTMQGRKPDPEQVRAIAAYLRTLEPPPSLDRLTQRVDRAAVRRGRELFDRQGCARCHAAPTYTSARTYDVGLQDQAGKRQFNPPSLRGVSQGGPFFHDNRAATLEAVFTRHRHQLKQELTKEELKDLLSFLRSL